MCQAVHGPITGCHHIDDFTEEDQEGGRQSTICDEEAAILNGYEHGDTDG